jgi:hypothetical protein
MFFNNYGTYDGTFVDIENPDVCSICLEELREHILKTECNHSFHKECFEPLIQIGNAICPICRKQLFFRNKNNKCFLFLYLFGLLIFVISNLLSLMNIL